MLASIGVLSVTSAALPGTTAGVIFVYEEPG